MSGSVLAICSYGGVLVRDTDGTYMKEGGESIAIRMDGTMNFSQFLEKVCSSWNFSLDGVLLKWLVPGSRCAPISLKGDLDLQNMLDFNSSSAIVDVFVSRADGSIGSDHMGLAGAVLLLHSLSIWMMEMLMRLVTGLLHVQVRHLWTKY
ncbi:uncharacterized protein LOC122068791 [Macadamia integrifolia]|uniref:uncharacterized protein LOC122068791 n=1 Tax=Macadamia integrifolia TaxID=60698 RepID=UPI001C4F88B9|nr:uncharacterized protein LOC122068791 [Macadamia integrifolia]